MIRIEKGFQYLIDCGLNLVATLNCTDLSDQTIQAMTKSGIPIADYQRLVLIGHGGRRMWEALQVSGMKTDDPIDHYSLSIAQQFIREYLDDSPVLWLYPDTRYVAPLQQLGETAGWCSRSPLGSDISPRFGVWFAYRAAFLIDVDLPLVREKPAYSTCHNCVEKPCISTCPAGAVRTQGMDIGTCAKHRLAFDSSCADSCLARLACPVKPEHRYTLEQVQYHYRHSLVTLRDWYGK